MYIDSDQPMSCIYLTRIWSDLNDMQPTFKFKYYTIEDWRYLVFIVNYQSTIILYPCILHVLCHAMIDSLTGTVWPTTFYSPHQYWHQIYLVWLKEFKMLFISLRSWQEYNVCHCFSICNEHNVTHPILAYPYCWCSCWYTIFDGA